MPPETNKTRAERLAELDYARAKAAEFCHKREYAEARAVLFSDKLAGELFSKYTLELVHWRGVIREMEKQGV